MEKNDILSQLRDMNEKIIPAMQHSERVLKSTTIAKEALDQFDSLTWHQWEADGEPAHSKDYLDNVEAILRDHQDVEIYGLAAAAVKGHMEDRFAHFRKHSLKVRLLMLFSKKFRDVTQGKEDAMATSAMLLTMLKFKQDILARYEIGNQEGNSKSEQ